MNDPRTEPLLEWNRLARENTENAIVSSMFEATAQSSTSVESFSTWLLVGTAAVASFFITNAQGILPFIGKEGFLVCGAFLCGSCFFGLLSKIYALSCKIGIEVGASIRKTFLEHLDKHEAEEEKINESAEHWGITLETGVRIERILHEYYSPQPKYVGWLAFRHFKKNQGNPQIGHLLSIRALHKQGLFTSLQALSVLGFLIAGFVYVAAI
ncbi:hypothetical protein [Crenobacter caeni]|uniref:Uncharacterized protein n=1 Tax=Crenobacter caeni TaxID=2705474 RepID=A0A6B2KUM2_9NEIS|nr:hypothetical protein [Crenobacter caeni]NDV13955.1 hypothetical protein [Crenobacter caeni]